LRTDGSSGGILGGHRTNVYSVDWHPSGARLASNSLDGTVRVWDLRTRQTEWVILPFEDGQITRPLKNLRFTESILEALSRVEMLGSELALIKAGWGSFATAAPAAKIGAFRFTGTTEF